MTKSDLTSKLAALACTALFSTVLVLGAVAPAQVAAARPVAASAVA